jgi:anti-sigma-K factor RskA
MSNATHVEELLAAYALDALVEPERSEAEALLERNPELWAQVALHHEVMAIVAESVEFAPSTPSAAVWENVVAQIEPSADNAPVFELAPVARRSSWLGRVAVGLSVAALVVSVFVGAQLLDDRSSNRLQAAVDELLREPDALVVTMADPAGGSTEARVVIGDDGIGWVYADTLPALDDDRTYQLWAILDGGDGQAVISAGVMGSDPGVSPFQVTGDLLGLAITEEVAGGVVASEVAPTTLWLADA